MSTSLQTPKIFISYSWKPVVNKQKTIQLAERLENEGVNVIIDEWNLAEGHDKYTFMEQMVNDPDVKRVLIICNKEYAEKANKKTGGVGTESLIISDEIYKKVDQTKFIPVIFERDPEGKEFVPTFIKSRIYIDLSSDDTFESEYQKLMRNIFDRPASKRPPRGTPPSYLFEEEPVYLKTAHKVKTIGDALKNEKRNSQVFIDDYYSTFVDALPEFEINNEDLNNGEKIDDVVLSRIEGLKALRNDFVSFLDVVLTYSVDFNLEKFCDFLERMLEVILRQESFQYPGRTIGSLMSDQYKFFYNELFLYITAVMIEKEKFRELGTILHRSFLVQNPRKDALEPYTFLLFNQYAESLNKVRNERLQMNRISVIADTIKQRADLPKYTFAKIQECDVLLYVIGIMQNETDDRFFWKRWFPHTTAYHVYRISLFEKLVSKRFFEKVKYLFAVNTIAELKVKVDKVISINADKIQRFEYEFPYTSQIFNFQKIGMYE